MDYKKKNNINLLNENSEKVKNDKKYQKQKTGKKKH